jgi:hypothetical protein
MSLIQHGELSGFKSLEIAVQASQLSFFGAIDSESYFCASLVWSELGIRISNKYCLFALDQLIDPHSEAFRILILIVVRYADKDRSIVRQWLSETRRCSDVALQVTLVHIVRGKHHERPSLLKLQEAF